jgi:2'-5' RNA ligase
MRLFAAIDPPADAVLDLDRAVSRTDDRLRWVRSDQWHITTAFYGEVDVATAADLGERLERAANRTSPLTLRIAAAGAFSRPRAARVLWAGVDGDRDVLRRLADRCRAAGVRAGVEMKAERFRPHLTLARSRRAPVDVSEAVSVLAPYTGPEWTATTLRLVCSTLGAAARHETVGKWPLGGSPS